MIIVALNLRHGAGQRDDRPIDRPSGAAGGLSAAPHEQDPHKQANLAAAFLAVAAERRGHPLLIAKNAEVSYAALAAAALRLRAWLCAEPGYRPGAVVAFRFANSAEYLACLYGALLADCIAAPLPSAIEAKRLQDALALIAPAFLIGDAMASADGRSSVATVDVTMSEDRDVAPPAMRRGGDDVAVLMLTSGSTGGVKAVMLSHRNLLANANAILRELPIRSDDRALVVLPFCHAFGNSVLQTHMLAGATLILSEPPFFPLAITEAIAAQKATSLSATPEMYELLARFGRLDGRALDPLRYMVAAGGPARPALVADLAQKIAPAAFYVMYGQTEATARLTSLSSRDLPGHSGSVGKAISGVALSVRDDAGHDLPAGAVGVLHARGDNVTPGYWRDNSATAQVIGADGWLRTGDLAHLDADGFVYLHGRENLLVKIHGHRVHPSEIEGLVEAQFPQLQALAVPMTRRGETRLALFVKARNGEDVDMASVQALCQKGLQPYKVPVRYELLQQIPLTSNHKVDRKALALLLPNED